MKHDFLVIRQIVGGKLKLVFKKELKLRVRFSSACNVYVVKFPRLGLYSFIANRKKLKRLVEDEIVYLWKLYMKEKPENLDENVRRIRKNMLNDIDKGY